jgi:3-oxoacyl-[acyl-carrier-protein] synthase III
MAFIEVKNVRIAGFAAGVPKNIMVNDRVESADYNAADFIATTGVKQKRYSDDFTTSDLCYYASEQLIKDLNWQKEDIDAIFFVSQNPDYILPATACILQERLGLSTNCYAMDISSGCSGWVYGLSTAATLLCNGSIKKALLMVGDARRRYVAPPGFLQDPLFGHGAGVTALEFNPGSTPMEFDFGTDGSGFDAIIIPEGGARNPFSEKSMVPVETEPGIFRMGVQSRMKGMDVFAFGITTAPKSVKKLAEQFSIELSEIDFFVFHQANKMMNEKIRKKLKLSEEKVPYSIGEFGNTSSATIPLTIVTELGKILPGKSTRLIGCGFGVGLSWGSVAFTLDNPVISSLVEV